MAIELEVNGQLELLDVADDATLAMALRECLGLSGVRIGCAAEQCGACHVLVDGESQPACSVPAIDLTGRSVDTVESLRDGSVEGALLAHGAGQCGYCLSGIVVSAHALFTRDPAPSEAQIRQALQPHLCRCGSQPRILRALRELASTGTNKDRHQ